MFGKEYMLFRVLISTGAAAVAAANGQIDAAAFAAAVAAGEVEQRWERCGRDGKDGTAAGRASDSRVHRCAREWDYYVYEANRLQIN